MEASNPKSTHHFDQRVPHVTILIVSTTLTEGRLSTVDVLVKRAYFVKKENYLFRTKSR